MSVKNPTNKAASIRQKLLNFAKENGQDFQRVIDSYAMECILDRLSRSQYADRFLLKGALLFAVWKGLGKRPTRDIDLMGRGSSRIDDVVRIFEEIVSINIPEDCITFFPDHVEGIRIKEDDEYEGVRIYVDGALSGATFQLQIDIGFGDAVTPSPVYSDFPRILDLKIFSLLTYPPETVFAEKLDAIVTRGLLNSRMKDYYDLWILIREEMVDPDTVKEAVKNTFQRRGKQLPTSRPVGLTAEFSLDSIKNTQWKAYLKKSSFEAIELSGVVERIRKFTETMFSDWK